MCMEGAFGGTTAITTHISHKEVCDKLTPKFNIMLQSSFTEI